MADQLNIEESKELTNRSIVAALETMETVKKQREEIELKENKAAMLDLAVTIYQGFISSIGMNEEFADFYNESISKMIEEEQETVQ